jgi:hypothetical protein
MFSMAGIMETALEELVFAYEVATQFPDVSGAEHLDILLIRSDIENYKSQLTHAQMQRLAVADNRLMRQARTFHIAIAQMANLAQWASSSNRLPYQRAIPSPQSLCLFVRVRTMLVKWRCSHSCPCQYHKSTPPLSFRLPDSLCRNVRTRQN